MPPTLPGLNYGAPLTIDDLSYLESIYTSEFRNRTLATIGSYRSAGPAYGILSASDPVNASTASDPFYISRNLSDPMRIDVNPGVCFTLNGMRVELTAAATAVEVARTTVGSQNVVLVEHVVVPDEDTTTRTRYNTTEVRRSRIADETSTDATVQTVLQVVSLTDWLDDTEFPPDRRAGTVPLALVNVVSADNTGGKQVDVDLSRTTVTTARPWFSPVDIAHRAFLGTGSTDTPHNLGLNDLSQGDLSLYDQLLNYGMVLGRDQDVPGVPGSLCFETITPARLKTDTNGTVTGTLSQRYVQLTRFPIRLLGAYSLPDPDNEILVDLMPRSNILLFSQHDAIPTTGMRVLYTTVAAAEPLPDSLVSNEVHVRQPSSTTDLLISGGRGHTVVQPRFVDQFSNARARLSVGSAPAIPKRYRIVADSTGSLLLTPQHLLCATKLDDLGTGIFDFETAMLGSARLRIGLQSVDLNAATVVTLRISGTDGSGNNVTEDVTFDFSNYTSPAIGSCTETASNFRLTDTVFTAASSIQVINRVSDGPNTAVCVWADLDPMVTDALRDLCPIAEAMWDGARICRVQDIRPVASRLGVPTDTTPVLLAAQALVANLAATSSTGVYLMLAEDLRDPHRFRLDNPLRYWKFSDGLDSAPLPSQPADEAAGLGLTQDRYVSHALRLVDGTSRSVLISLYGKDAQQYVLNGQDGNVPDVEYRWSLMTAPSVWTAWTSTTALSGSDGVNHLVTVDDDAFKFQLRVKASAVGVSAVQFTQIGGSQQISGTRYYTARIQVGETHRVALPFGTSLPTASYRIVVTPRTQTNVLAPGDPGLEVVYIERFVDHAVVHLTRRETYPSSGVAIWTIDWMVDRAGYTTALDGGFGDTIV